MGFGLTADFHIQVSSFWRSDIQEVVIEQEATIKILCDPYFRDPVDVHLNVVVRGTATFDCHGLVWGCKSFLEVITAVSKGQTKIHYGKLECLF